MPWLTGQYGIQGLESNGKCMERNAGPLGCVSESKRGSFPVLFCFLFFETEDGLGWPGAPSVDRRA